MFNVVTTYAVNNITLATPPVSQMQDGKYKKIENDTRTDTDF